MTCPALSTLNREYTAFLKSIEVDICLRNVPYWANKTDNKSSPPRDGYYLNLPTKRSYHKLWLYSQFLMMQYHPLLSYVEKAGAMK
jgi:hypothetical protein